MLLSIGAAAIANAIIDGPTISPAQTWNIGSPVSAVALSPDGNRVAVGLKDGNLQVRQSKDGTVLWQVLAHSDKFISSVFSHDGRMLATSGYDQVVRLWQTDNGTQLHSWAIGPDSSVALAFSQDDTMLATGSSTRAVRIVSTSSGALVSVIPAYPQRNGGMGYVLSIAFSTDGSMLTWGADDNMVYRWQLSSGQLLSSQPGMKMGSSSHLRNLVIGAGGALSAANIDTSNGIVVSRVSGSGDHGPLYTLVGHRTEITTLSFSSDGQKLASGGGLPQFADYPYSADTNIRIWSMVDGQQELILKGHTDDVNSVGWGSDNSHLVSGSKDGTVRLWNLK